MYFFDVRGEAPKLLVHAQRVSHVTRHTSHVSQVMSNFEEPFNVMSSSVVMPLYDNRDKLNGVLDLIPRVRPNPLSGSSAMGAAVQVRDV